MREFADANGFPADHELRTLADQFDEVNVVDDPKALVSRWARARKAWVKYSGEELV